MGIVERGGRAILTVARNVKKKAVDELMELVAAGSVIITNDFRSYMT